MRGERPAASEERFPTTVPPACPRGREIRTVDDRRALAHPTRDRGSSEAVRESPTRNDGERQPKPSLRDGGPPGLRPVPRRSLRARGPLPVGALGVPAPPSLPPLRATPLLEQIRQLRESLNLGG